ncbi:50S ribosomal protein L3 N(5)-glutamine methyltransferase [Cellvibrio sp. KY-YJ-3]|uniref:50S ribosomal protein L3 N(5)-glutamine methyltransferase n=1 Tax=Cellvibrio sp. KY-YJ-3 TaxID=454662 RepID=UPI0012471634|nr:50S ribosomal protein L3 N(5)-glutamine methyltransferase [Cellvibrio sp. KY-YJ-3]QEY13213.1 50S ribosomal protein L3 N(5)-glutamine methyltransferase [Cellvibrio sp. KY-YJ-3]
MALSPSDFDAARDELLTIRDFLRWGASEFIAAKLFYGHGTDNPWDEAEQLVLHAINLSPPLGDEWLDARLTLPERKKVVANLARRIQERVPAAYITRQAWFAGLPFAVDERVLVPRSPIGELIQKQFEPWLVNEPAQILDLCTGSGCIGIACAYAFPEAYVQLSDISFDALAVAEENIEQHGLAERVFAMQSDLFENLQGQVFDLIVSNPPYVDAEDMASLPEEYHAEPELGLASGDDGLDFTRRLLTEAVDYLSEQGVLLVEVGNSWPALEAAYPALPFTWIEFERGGHGVFVLNAEDLRKARADGIL